MNNKEIIRLYHYSRCQLKASTHGIHSQSHSQSRHAGIMTLNNLRGGIKLTFYVQ